MKVIDVSNKVLLVRHWLRWYRVQRGASDWQKLAIRPRVRSKSIDSIVKGLHKKYPPAPMPPILDEKVADAEVAKNINKAKHKKRAV